MRGIFFVELLFFSATALAVSVSNEGSNLVLSDFSCEKVHDVIQQLAVWTKTIEPEKVCSAADQPLLKGLLSCSAVINQCVPDHVIKYQGVNPAEAGPNCWNLALVMTKILPSLRFSTPAEMTFYMRSPLCRELQNGEPRRAGDIGVIRTNKFSRPEESHGFIYISEDIAYSKNGASNRSAFALQSLEGVYRIYQVPRESKCRQNQVERRNGCRNSASFFRCKSMDEYLREYPDLDPKILASLKGIDRFENCLEETTIHDVPLSKEAKQNLADVVIALGKYLESEMQTGVKMNDPPRSFVLGSLQLRLRALVHQLKGDDDLLFAKALMVLSKTVGASADILPIDDR